MLVIEFPYMEIVWLAFFRQNFLFFKDDTSTYMPKQEKKSKIRWLHISKMYETCMISNFSKTFRNCLIGIFVQRRSTRAVIQQSLHRRLA